MSSLAAPAPAAALDVPSSLWSQLGRLVEIQTAAANSASAASDSEAARRADRMRAIDCLIRKGSYD